MAKALNPNQKFAQQLNASQNPSTDYSNIAHNASTADYLNAALPPLPSSSSAAAAAAGSAAVATPLIDHSNYESITQVTAAAAAAGAVASSSYINTGNGAAGDCEPQLDKAAYKSAGLKLWEYDWYLMPAKRQEDEEVIL